MQVFGLLLLIAGVVVIGSALGMDVSISNYVPGGLYETGKIQSVANMDLVAQRSDRMVLGCAIAIMGAIFMGAGAMVDAIRPKAPTVSKAEAARRSLGDLAKDEKRRGTVA